MKTFSMSTYNESVDEFHLAFNHPRNKVEDVISLKIRRQRLNLIFEELEELSQAMDTQEAFASLCAYSHEKWKYRGSVIDGDNVNKKEELDALCDIQYVLSGAIISLGHYANFDKAFDDVHTSNMSKMCANLREVDDTVMHYIHVRGESDSNIKYTKKGDKYIVYRVADDKILKNVHYSAVDLTKYI